jgi:glyoxylate reductase
MKILVTRQLPEEVLLSVREEHDVEMYEGESPMDRTALREAMRDKQGLLCTISDQIDDELMSGASNLKMIANFGVGYNNIDVAAASARGILVSNTPDVLTDATADLAFALILAAARRIVEGDRTVREKRFRKWSPFFFLGREVSGKTLGIVGLGRIGKAVARRARGFDMPVLYYNRRRIQETEEKALGAVYVDLKTVLARCDFLTLHVPLTEETFHLISKEELQMMKPTAFLINASRGPVVDEKALVQALKKGHIAGAGLDVFENEPQPDPSLMELDNTVLLPHIGSATLETRTAMARKAMENLLAGIMGERPPDCVNWKDVL